MKINDTRVCKEDIEELSLLAGEYMKRKKRKRKKRIYLLVALVSVAVMGIGAIGIGEAEMIIEIKNDGNRTTMNAYHEGENPGIGDEYNKEEELFEQAKEIYGIDICRFLYMPPGTSFKDGDTDSKEKTCTFTYSVEDSYIKYSVADVKHEQDKGRRLKVAGIYVYTSSSNNIYTATFSYKNLYYTLTTNLSEKEFQEIVSSIMTF